MNLVGQNLPRIRERSIDINKGNEDIFIRAGSLEDIPVVLEFRELLFKESGTEESLLIKTQSDTMRTYYQQETAAGRMRHLIAFDSQSRPVAVVGSLLKNDFPHFMFKPGFYGWILDVYTLPEFRGIGLASELLDRNIQWLKEKGVHEIKLIAFSTKARGIYEKVGFKATHEMNLQIVQGPSINELIKES